MRPYQLKYFNQGRDSVLNDLKNGVPINSDTLIALLNDFQTARSEMTEQTVQRDDAMEMLGTTTEKFQSSDAIGHDLAGRINALVAVVNAALKAGNRITTD